MTKNNRRLPPLYRAAFPLTPETCTAQIAGVRAVLETCTSTGLLPLPDPDIDALTRATDELGEVVAELEQRRKELAALLSVRADRGASFRQGRFVFLNHIDNIARGDATVIRGAGLEPRYRSRRSSAAGAVAVGRPLWMLANPGVRPGEVHLRWQAVPGARSYALERSERADGGFTHLEVCVRVRRTLEAQPSAMPVWYRVAAVTPAGQGAFGEPVAAVLL